ncbi:MAG: NAD(P)-binding domain-containing protein [Thermomicrobiales bacterium]
MTTEPVGIIGAGPYGLAAAAHLRAAGVETRVFGEPMAFWERQMPAGMLLRSYWEASHIADPDHDLSLNAYETASCMAIPRPVPLDRFVAYGRWFGQQIAPDLEARHVARIEPDGRAFRLVMADGESIRAGRVVVATGIAAFARRPAPFADLAPALVSHTADWHDFAAFAGRQVAVIGGGQSALESAALLHEAGAHVEVIVRATAIHWLRYGSGSKLHAALHSDRNPLKPLLYPSSDVGPPGLNYLVDKPALFTKIPTRALRGRAARRAIRPAGSGWLRPRLRDVPITTGIAVMAAQAAPGDRLRLALSDGTARTVDHALLATGYAVDIARYPFLTSELLRGLDRIAGYPRLTAGFESSVPGLHFLGAPAAESFGPLMRFVAGTGYAARGLTGAVCGSRLAVRGDGMPHLEPRTSNLAR